MPLLQIKNIECRYRDQVVAQNLSFHVNEGQIVSLLGPSGCGKTTVLRAIAGFEPVHTGEISLLERTISSPQIQIPPEQRLVGMVFQDYALFPHMNVRSNICFGLRNVDHSAALKTADEMLEVVGLSGYGKRYPHELSGGQQQRVALARALAPRPKMLLLDEPFSSLDIELRERLGTEIRDILKDQGITAILVTHDQNEAFAMCEQIGIMQEGRILQWDTPYNLYHEPADRYTADFVGQGVFLKGKLLDPETLETELGVIQGNRAYTLPIGSIVDVLVRPDDIVPDKNSSMGGEILQKAFRGPEILYTLQLPTGATVLSMFPSHQNHEIGEHVNFSIDTNHLIAFPTEN